MFTGIITEIGEVLQITHTADAALITVAAQTTLTDVQRGASIAVDGVCLTVTDFTKTQFTADVMAETLQLTTLGEKRGGDRVNLERAMPASGRFDGHIVQGHVDGRAQVTAISPGERWTNYRLHLPTTVGRYLAQRGSVALNGTSLTLTEVTDHDQGGTSFGVSLIPTTLADTNFGTIKIGDEVNVEVDVVAKYVERLSK